MYITKDQRGLTLIELLVTIAILAIVSGMLITSYTNEMENNRKDADLTNLMRFDNAIKSSLMENEAFEQVKDDVFDYNKLTITIPVKQNPQNTKKGQADIEKAYLNGTESNLLQDSCAILYEYITDELGTKIDLQSSSYRKGTYTVRIEFGGTQVSEIREFEINNDTIDVSNTKDAGLKK